jgi:hypothetical protein
VISPARGAPPKVSAAMVSADDEAATVRVEMPGGDAKTFHAPLTGDASGAGVE